MREIKEELLFIPPLKAVEISNSLSLVGMINDESNEVGKVHFGFVYEFRAPKKLEIRAKKEIQRITFLPVIDLKRKIAAGANFENWSKMLIDFF